MSNAENIGLTLFACNTNLVGPRYTYRYRPIGILVWLGTALAGAATRRNMIL